MSGAVVADLLFAVLRLGHALAAALWVGGLVGLLLTHPGADDQPPADLRRFREALKVGIGVFLVTGAVMAVERLTAPGIPPSYVALLAVKVILALWLFALARRLGLDGARTPQSASLAATWRRWRMAAIGVGIYGLALGLRVIFERTALG